MLIDLKLNKNKVAEFCKRHHISWLALFGSVLTDNFRPDRDVDVLLEFEPDHVPGLIKLAGLERELSEIVGRKVDVRTPEDLSKHFREEVLATVEPDDQVRLTHTYFDINLDFNLFYAPS